MTARLITKHSNVTGKIPLSADLLVGELAVNTEDGILYVKNVDQSIKVLGGDINAAISTKVDKVTGKGLSTEDYTTAEKERLSDAIIAETDPVFLASEAASFVTGDKDKLDAVGVAGNNLAVQFNNNGVQDGFDAFQYDPISSSVKIGESVSLLPNNPLAIQRDVDSYLQVNLKNMSESVDASSDYIVTANDGSDLEFYGDFGICNSLYASDVWDVVEPHDTYIFADGGNIALVSLTPGKKIRFSIAQTNHEAHPEDVIAEITASGFNVMAGMTITINGVPVMLSSVLIDEDDFFSNSAVHLPTQQSTKAYVDAAIFAAGSYTDEQAQDATGSMIVAGTKTGITVTYDDANNKIDFDASHNHTGVYAPVLGGDDNYVTDAEKSNLHAPGSDNQVIPDQLSDLSDDSTHRLCTDTEKTNYGTAYTHSQAAHAPSVAEQNVNADWNASSGDAQIMNKPTIPTTLAALSDDSMHRTVTDTEKATWNSAGGVSQSMALAYAIAL
jgi:hypothetical protein